MSDSRSLFLRLRFFRPPKHPLASLLNLEDLLIKLALLKAEGLRGI